ncbi:hypothetical protein [Candidatus Thioglobus sp.]|jgi:hypothetical protein|uniref:hypothetical protein n=1 Tax=Candidatus Thioglobus sp. TaxID=2026721 RepID=UPI0017633EF5|nr:hypothetical protein [Candidatus Thioglobus sp.]
MKVMITINTIVLMLLLVATRASAEVSRPYQVFNPSTMFDLFPHASTQRIDSAFHNYGNKSYDFVVESISNSTTKVQKHLASLENNYRR